MFSIVWFLVSVRRSVVKSYRVNMSVGRSNGLSVLRRHLCSWVVPLWGRWATVGSMISISIFGLSRYVQMCLYPVSKPVNTH